MKRITAKMLASEIDVSIKTAEKLIKDIKAEYDIKIVLKPHVQHYFKIPINPQKT